MAFFKHTQIYICILHSLSFGISYAQTKRPLFPINVSHSNVIANSNSHFNQFSFSLQKFTLIGFVSFIFRLSFIFYFILSCKKTKQSDCCVCMCEHIHLNNKQSTSTIDITNNYCLYAEKPRNKYHRWKKQQTKADIFIVFHRCLKSAKHSMHTCKRSHFSLWFYVSN